MMAMISFPWNNLKIRLVNSRVHQCLNCKLLTIALLTVSTAVSAIGTFPPALDVADLDGDNGFTITSVGDTPHFARTVSGDGDFNGDGIADFILGDPGAARPPGGYAEGQAYIVFGTRDGFPATLSVSALDGVNGFSVTGNIQFAESVSNAGDVNNDGIDDVIISERVANAGLVDNGRVYILFGRNTATSGDFPANINVSTYINGSNGFVIVGESAGDLAGNSVAGAGDVNGDGIEDVIIGATQDSFSAPHGTGAAYIVFGRDVSSVGDFPPAFNLSNVDGENGFKLNGIDIDDRTGYHVSSAGDVNHDGVSDVIIGTGYVPRTFVVFGRDVGVAGQFPASLNLADLDGDNGFLITGDRARSIGSAGDFNHDGIDDLILGQNANSSLELGRAYIIYGINAATGPGFPGNFDLNTLNGSNGFKLIGISPGSGIDGTGRSVGGIGDINDDGIDDVAIKNQPFGLQETYVLFGRDTAVSGEFASPFYLSSLDGVNGFVVTGTSEYRGYESGPPWSPKVARAGDVNDDGIGDMVIGTGQEAAYVIFGRGDVVSSIDVAIDVNPGNKRNVINPRKQGRVWVAILSDLESPFDPVSQVNISTVAFGPDGAIADRYKVKDVNSDGLGDLLLRFRIPATGIACGDTNVTLIGETFDGQSFSGTDLIKTVGCKKTKKSGKK